MSDVQEAGALVLFMIWVTYWFDRATDGVEASPGWAAFFVCLGVPALAALAFG